MRYHIGHPLPLFTDGSAFFLGGFLEALPPCYHPQSPGGGFFMLPDNKNDTFHAFARHVVCIQAIRIFEPLT